MIQCLCIPTEGIAAELAEGGGGCRGLCSTADIPLPSFVLQEICASSVPSTAPRSIATRCGSHALLISPAGSGRCIPQAAGLGPTKAGLWGPGAGSRGGGLARRP